MSNLSVTFDDFDPVIRYANYEVWQTPNPQDHPTWWNASQQETQSPWHQATYHNTTAQGPDSEFSLWFVGNRISIYGAETGINWKLDGNEGGFTGVNPPQTHKEGRQLIFTQEMRSYGNHSLTMWNEGEYLLLDFIEVNTVVGAEGAEMKNTTVDDRDTSVLKFDGEWTQQEGDNFFDKTSTWTGTADASVSFNFSGSAVWVYGDQVNDHGEFAVYVNGSQVAANNGRSGCGGGYAKYCEKLHGLAFFAGSLPEGTHEVRIVNQSPANGNKTFFDLDYVEYTTPSKYASSELYNATGSSNGTTAGGNGTAAGSPSAPAPSGSSTSKPGAGHSGASSLLPSATLALVLGAYVLRSLV